MNLKNLTSYLVNQPAIYGHLGNSFFNQKRFNIKDSQLYFTVEQQTLFNFKLVFHIETIKKTAYIVATSPDDFYIKYKLLLKYFHDFPNENYIVI